MDNSEGALTVTLTLTVMDKDIVVRIRDFMENEAKSCSREPGCITPLYVYRMWGGQVSLEEVSKALDRVRYEF